MNSAYPYSGYGKMDQGFPDLGLSSLLSPKSVLWGVVIVIGFLILFGLILSKGTTVNLSQRNAPAPAKPIVPVVQPKAAAPKLVKLDAPAPTMEPKALVAPAPAEPKAASVDDTFEAYRQAILASGPLQMQEEAQTALQSKNGAANYAAWRDQTAALRNSLKEETAAAFLERTNVSINDRMVAFFDAVKA